MTQSNPREHPPWFKNKNVCCDFEYAMHWLIPSPVISRDAALALFEGRATYSEITSWRFANRTPPQWACELLANKLRKLVRPALATADVIERLDRPGKGCYGTENLRRYRERKARERDAKEKAPD